MPGKTTTAGYGWTHQQERERWRPQVEAGTVDCWRCVERIRGHRIGDHIRCNPDGCTLDRKDPRIHPHEPWDLGHDDHNRARYCGPEHRGCNRRAGAQQAARVRGWTWKRKPGRRVQHPELSVPMDEL